MSADNQETIENQENAAADDAAAAVKSAGRKKRVALVTCILAALIIAGYEYGVYYYGSHFFPNTYIDGINVGGLKSDEADKLLDEKSSAGSFTIIGRSGSEQLDLSLVSAVKHYEPSETAIKSQDRLKWPVSFAEDTETELGCSISYDKDLLTAGIQSLSMIDNENSVSPVSAHAELDSDTGVYELIPETEGNRVDKRKLIAAVRKALSAGADSIDLNALDGVYCEPSVRSDDAELIRSIDVMNRLQKAGATLDMGAGLIISLDGEMLYNLLNADNTVNEKAARAYVQSLAGQYNTVSADGIRRIINHSGIVKSIKSDYGWQLDEENTLAALTELTGKTVRDFASDTGSSGEADAGSAADSDASDIVQYENTDAAQEESAADNAAAQSDTAADADSEDTGYGITAVWKKTAASHGANDYGFDYIEADLGEQNVYVFINGACVLSTPCVSGRMTKERMTPEGIFAIKYKQTDRVLTGYKPDGSIDYQSPVKYWMPFYMGVGLHDASWRGKFGGTLYVYGGSHGCVNLPRQAAAGIYEICYKGMPVICYY